MDKIFNLISTIKSTENDDGSVTIRGMASTVDKDRANDVVKADAWTKSGGLNNFKKNPIILFNHNYQKPIGRATEISTSKKGLELEAKISSGAGDVAQLIKDGVLSAFSVGFIAKDTEYDSKTDIFVIKEAELLEVSVVSVPCNQEATFSVAKSFDSKEEYEAFKHNMVELAGQSLATEEEDSSDMASEDPSGDAKKRHQETKTMDEAQLEALAKKVAEETATKMKMQRAEEKAAEEAAAKKAAEDASAKEAAEKEIAVKIKTGLETGTEKLLEDLKADFEKAKEEDIAGIVAKYEADLKEKADELEAMRNSKRDFSNRGVKKGEFTDAEKQQLVYAKVLGAITKKGWETDYAKELFEKAGVDGPGAARTPVGTDATLDLTVTTTFEEEVRQEQKVAGLFREVNVTSGATMLPFAPDVYPAYFGTGGFSDGTNTLTGKFNNAAQDGGADTDGPFQAEQIILKAFRLISGTFLDNNTDEQLVISLLPMITSGLARSHALAKDRAFLFGSSGNFAGLCGNAGDPGVVTGALAGVDATSIDASAGDPEDLLRARKGMGKYGLSPSDVTYIVSNEFYYSLIDSIGWTDIDDVGTLATKLKGMVGMVYGSPVVVSDQFNAATAADAVGVAVNTSNYIIPRLRGVNIETEYSVEDQRTVLVATQSLGFTELAAGYTDNLPSVYLVHS